MIKRIANVFVITGLGAVLLLLAQNLNEEIKTYEEPDYSDTKGCAADVRWDYNLCA